MKCAELFFLKKKKKRKKKKKEYLIMLSAAVVIGALRVDSLSLYCMSVIFLREWICFQG